MQTGRTACARVRGEDGSQIPVGVRDADHEYAIALDNAALAAVKDKLLAEGFTEYVDVVWEGETHCDGPG